MDGTDMFTMDQGVQVKLTNSKEFRSRLLSLLGFQWRFDLDAVAEKPDRDRRMRAIQLKQTHADAQEAKMRAEAACSFVYAARQWQPLKRNKGFCVVVFLSYRLLRDLCMLTKAAGMW